MNLFQRIRIAYSDLRLQTKFTLALVLIVFIPAVFIATFFYTQLYDMVISDTIRREQNAAAATVPAIDAALEDIHDSSSHLADLAFYEDMFFAPISEDLADVLTSRDAAIFYTELEALIEDSSLQTVRIYLDLPESEFPSQDSGEAQNANNVFSSVSSARTYWRGIFRSSSIKELYCPPSYLGEQERSLYGDLAYIRSTTIYYKGNSTAAYIACYYPKDVLTVLLSDSLSLSGSVSYLINDHDEIAASTDAALSGTYRLNYFDIQESFMSSNNFVQMSILEQDVYAAYYSVNTPRWFMVTVLPERPMIQIAARLIWQIVLIYLIFLIFALFLANLLSRSITRRISSVIDQMHQVRYAPPTPIQIDTSHDEVGELIETYNYMTRKMNELIDNQAKVAEDLRIAEFNSLQAQINPHFLYNTMDMINWLAQQGKMNEISHAVQDLSRFYKLTLSRKKSISSIANEEEHVSIYIRLQNMRFHDQIDFISDIPDELLDYSIPKLTLQPVVENAILHGILGKESKSGTIVLTGWKDGKDIVLLISDDGIGIAENKLPQILSGNGNSGGNGTNIAIYNTHRRLQILYGSAYGLHYISEPGKGTEVEIRIPSIPVERESPNA